MHPQIFRNNPQLAIHMDNIAKTRLEESRHKVKESEADMKTVARNFGFSLETDSPLSFVRRADTDEYDNPTDYEMGLAEKLVVQLKRDFGVDFDISTDAEHILITKSAARPSRKISTPKKKSVSGKKKKSLPHSADTTKKDAQAQAFWDHQKREIEELKQAHAYIKQLSDATNVLRDKWLQAGAPNPNYQRPNHKITSEEEYRKLYQTYTDYQRALAREESERNNLRTFASFS